MAVDSEVKSEFVKKLRLFERKFITPVVITIIFIIFATVVAAFVRKRNRNRCLKDFWHNMVTLEETGGSIILVN